jgi:hypothetical protein
MTAPSARQLQQWFDGKEFTTDWTSPHVASWSDVLEPFREKKVEVLEVGALEGRSSIFFLRFLSLSRLTAIDSFWDKAAEDRFNANTREFAQRLEVIKKLSVNGLHDLIWAGREFDFIYLDGTHERDLVVVDSILAWKVLKVGGVLIWDDYGLGNEWPDEWRPRTGIDLFLRMQLGSYKLLHKADQVVIRRTKGRDPMPGTTSKSNSSNPSA